MELKRLLKKLKMIKPKNNKPIVPDWTSLIFSIFCIFVSILIFDDKNFSHYVMGELIGDKAIIAGFLFLLMGIIFGINYLRQVLKWSNIKRVNYKPLNKLLILTVFEFIFLLIYYNITKKIFLILLIFFFLFYFFNSFKKEFYKQFEAEDKK
jgi:hypothetical protein